MENVIMLSVPVDRFLRLNSVLDRTGLSRATLYRKIEAGTFPRQIRIGERCCGWRESEVAVWQKNPACFRANRPWDDGPV
jgi:prophage regulatory protein